MKLTILSLVATCAFAASSYEAILSSNEISTNTKWEFWKNAFGRVYETEEQDMEAFSKFAQNDRIIQVHNAKGLSYELGHNEFSDMTWDEFKGKYVSGLAGNPYLRRTRNFVSLPETGKDAVDWVANGAVTDIKNQGQCGSCWAFSTTGSFEGAYQIATGKLQSFSEQQLVSCDKVDDGCSGGLMDNAFGFIEKNGGICTEESYPYNSGAGEAGPCETSCSNVATLTGFSDVPSKDENQLKSAVSLSTVSVAIEADRSVFQLYKGGVFTSSAQCGKQLDHGVLVVGFGVDGGTNYWKVKNSWGESWGEQGYIRMERDVDCCGISSQPSYPTGVKNVGPGPAPGPSPAPGPAPGPPPGPGTCDIKAALECGEAVLPCLAKCKEGPLECFTCLADDFPTCCPCAEKVFPSIIQCSNPGPSPGPSPSGHSHYGAPPCLPDEKAVQVEGISGDFCSPPCQNGACPTDVPSGVTANPTCALKGPSGDQYCALECNPAADDGQCGTGTCQNVQAGIGICTYDSENDVPSQLFSRM